MASSSTDKKEKATYKKALKANKKVAKKGEPLQPGQTHEQDGKQVTRKRFSSI